MAREPVDRERLLAFLRKDAGRPLKAKEIAGELDIPGDRYRELRELLRKLEEEGLIYRQRKGRYAAPENINLAIGRLQVTRSGDGFVLPEGGGEDVYVPARNLGTAVEDDRVVARIERRGGGRNPEGKVIRILERAWKRVVGAYHPRKGYGFVIPSEPRLRTDVFIPPGKDAGAEDGEIVAAEIVEWGEPGPVGQVVRRLGGPEDPGVDVLAILLGHQLPLEFPPDIDEEAERIAARGLTPDDIEGREDLRHLLAFTIDPADAKDHDDALSIEALDGGGARVGVHIADVSHYVHAGSRLDREARERATSVYLVDRVVPMLPHPLSGGLCSLRPGEDRLVLSVLFDIDAGGRVRGSRLVRSAIRSRHRLSYDEANGLLDDGGGGPPELTDALRRLDGIARAVRHRRHERGSIDFDLPESRVVLNEAGEPTDIERVLRLPTHRLVEDLMILANETIARLALEHEVPVLFRIHDEPADEKLEGLRELAATFGFQLPRRKIEPRDLARLVEAMEGTPQSQLVSTVTLRSMKQARYSSENIGHFGLASEAYLHFTSPIRRYPDLLVHRQLHQWLEGRSAARAYPLSASELPAIADHCSERERRAVQAERDSVDLKKIEYMERHLGDEFAGTIAGVTAFGLFVLLDDYLVEGLVHVSSLDDDYYLFVEEQHALVGRRRHRRFQLGDPVRVQLVRVDREQRHIDFELLEAPAAARGESRADGRGKGGDSKDDKKKGDNKKAGKKARGGGKKPGSRGKKR